MKNGHRTEREALQEIGDRIEYFCFRTDGTWDPPWAKEIYEIAFEGLNGRYPDERTDDPIQHPGL